ncbi:CapA family protein [Conexibacter sp. S30A1]|uniref:CapA family protein n=1 Tax=Conexibacter sp. S30A1 TaxID=2937800 RepID=UPI0020102B8D|nr:CapA family protein [Conexibacter sp. S30A1]
MSARILIVGDLILDEPDPDSFFAPSAPRLCTGDVVIGQVEVPHSTRGRLQSTDVPAPPARPEHLEALPKAGFNVATLAGNHLADQGADAIEDTITKLRELGIHTTGAGMTLREAREPARIAAGGVSVAVFSYNCVGPKDGWARASKPGCAYVNVLTHYELDHASPGGPPTIYTFAAPESVAELRVDLAAVRPTVDIVVVALHKGIGHVRSQIAMYERDLSHAVIDAGADIVVGHHAHIMRGIEIYRGRPIYHGLGNFVTVTSALSPTDSHTPEARAWALRREQLYGFRPDPKMPTYPFNPESRNTIIADCEVDADGSLSPGLIPCWIDDDARPVPLGREEGQRVVDYVRTIGEEAGLATEFEWDGERVRVWPAAGAGERE